MSQPVSLLSNLIIVVVFVYVTVASSAIVSIPCLSAGSIQANRPALVGERGPELFVPRTAGSITPSSLTPGKMGGGGSLVINQNLNFALGVTNTVRSEIANLLPTIQQSTLSAVSDAKLRGGKFAKAFGG